MRLDSLTAEAYTFATDAPEADGTFAWDKTTVVVVEVKAGSQVGIGWTYAPAMCADVVGELLWPAVSDLSAEDGPLIYHRMLAATRNATRPGLVTMAISAVDNAVWDLRARLLDVPLDVLLGRARAAVPIYGSGGFTTYGSEQLERQIEGWREDGISQIKIKIGESAGSNVARDLERVDQASALIGDKGSLFVDANGGYTTKQAMRVGRELQQRGVTWYEEPVSSDDHDGLRWLREQLTALDVTAGEYGFDLDYFRQLVDDRAVDCVQIDVTRCGGITAWQQIAAVAQARHLQVSGHCAPLQHLAVAASTPQLRHLEYFHDHVRIEALLFEEVPRPQGGALRPFPAPGNGLRLNRPRIQSARVR